METTVDKSDRYGIIEKKKAELDALEIKVFNQEDRVIQLQAIVDSLTKKLTKFQGFLVLSEKDRTQALNNKDQLDGVINNAKDLMNASKIAFKEIGSADKKTKKVALEENVVINKLIYSAEVINKLANMVVRQKAVNPLISDELISMISTAGSDANNAVALTLIALKAVYAAQSASIESLAISTLEYAQSEKLYQVLTGRDVDGKIIKGKKSLKKLIGEAYTRAKKDYKKALEASVDTTIQLNETTAKLDKALVKLNSLKSGLAAANAAALAS